MKWREDEFTVEMPHLLPGQLSEVEMLKLFAVHQWRAIADMLGVPAEDIVNDHGERLYGSFINVIASLGEKTYRDFTEGDRIHLRHTARLYARRFVEGVILFDGAEIPDSEVPPEIGPEALERVSVPHLYATNAFVARGASNSRLKTFAPAGDPPSPDDVVEDMPFGIRDHEGVHRSGEIEFPGLESARPVPGMEAAAVEIPLVLENDVNGAGLIYFARYVALMNYGERRALQHLGPVPVSYPLVTQMSTERRHIFFFANADPNDAVRVQSSVFAESAASEQARHPRFEIPLRLYFVSDLFRVSDGVLMAKSVVRKALCLPRKAKRMRYEAERLLRIWHVD